MKSRQSLPDNYHLMIVEMEGRYYPVRIEERTTQGDLQLHYSPHLTWSFEAEYSIPSALGPQHTCGVVSFARYGQAVDYCHRYHENFQLLFQYRETLAGTADYPERNVWYLEEIQKYTSSRVHIHVSPWWVLASTFLHHEYCSVKACSIDTAIVQLYDAVVEHIQQSQAQTA